MMHNNTVAVGVGGEQNLRTKVTVIMIALFTFVTFLGKA